MANIPSNAPSTITTINKFFGLNEDTMGDTQLKLGESPNMYNFRVTENMQLTKREGYTRLFDAVAGITGTIRGMWYGNLNGVNRLIFVTNQKIYQVTSLISPNPTQIGTTVLSVDGVTNFFYFGSKLYLINGTDYLSWDGVATSFSSVVGYIPLVAYASLPDGSNKTLYEGINLLINKRHQQFNGDNTSNTYYLLEKGLTSVDSVYVDGVLKTVTTDYTVNLTNGTVNFVVKPPVGANNVDIYWTKGTAQRSVVTKYKYSSFFGINSSQNVYLYGDGSNSMIHSSIANGIQSAEYFEAVNVQNIGTDHNAITSIVRQYDKQIISTNGGETFYSMYELVSDETGAQSWVNTIRPLSNAIGNVAYGQGQLINNVPFVIQNGVYGCYGTIASGESNMRYMSKNVQTSLSNEYLENAKTVDFEHKKEYWISVNKDVWIYNYLHNIWYKFTLSHTPSCYLIIDDKLYFGTDNAKIMYFDETAMIDDSIVFNSYWESGFYDFGTSYLEKYLSQMWVTMKPGLPQTSTIYWATENTPISAGNTISIEPGFDFGNVDFGNFSFGTGNNPKPIRINVKAKKFVYFKVILKNSGTVSATLISINLQTRQGGVSK